MVIYHDLTIDLLHPRQNVIHVVQEDSQRKLRLTLLSDNTAYDVSSGLNGETLLKLVQYCKSDKVGGIYDTTSLGETAVQLEDSGTPNVWIVALDVNCFTVPGWTIINVRFETASGKRIATFQILADVQANASAGMESESYNNINSITGLTTAVEDLQSNAVRVVSQNWTNNQKAVARGNIQAASAWVENATATIYNGDIPMTEGATLTVQITDILNFQIQSGVYPAINSPVIGRNNIVGILTKPSQSSHDYLITSTGRNLLEGLHGTWFLTTSVEMPTTDVLKQFSSEDWTFPDGVHVGDVLVDRYGWMATVMQIETINDITYWIVKGLRRKSGGVAYADEIGYQNSQATSQPMNVAEALDDIYSILSNNGITI